MMKNVHAKKTILIAIIIAATAFVVTMGTLLIIKSSTSDVTRQEPSGQDPKSDQQAAIVLEKKAETAYIAGDVASAKKFYEEAKRSYQAANNPLKVQDVEIQLHLIERQSSVRQDSQEMKGIGGGGAGPKVVSPDFNTNPPNTFR